MLEEARRDTLTVREMNVTKLVSAVFTFPVETNAINLKLSSERFGTQQHCSSLSPAELPPTNR
jgi:hypothetical protein